LYKTELIRPRGPWKTIEQVELATLEWVDWYNHARLHSACGNIPPVEYEERYLTEAAALRPRPQLAEGPGPEALASEPEKEQSNHSLI
jgi:Integrase core domain